MRPLPEPELARNFVLDPHLCISYNASVFRGEPRPDELSF
jgi:hypothetical protein